MAEGDAPDSRSRRIPDKFAKRRSELARAALNTLAELGYARTSLREIAQNSEFSHGVLHYYFNDKVELITVCVRDYKTSCVQRYDRITTDARTYAELIETFLQALVTTLREDAKMHRLWYDLRAQALFEPAFRSDVMEIDRSLEALIWRLVSRAAELAKARIALPPPALYATFDGLFQHALLRQLDGDETAGAELQRRVRELLPTCLAPLPALDRANAA
jgi:AcrR family transcriptional regulator